MVRIVLISALLLLMASCGCLNLVQTITLSQDDKRLERCKCDLAEIAFECPELLRSDTIGVTVPYIAPGVQVDTIVKLSDSLSLSKDRWSVQYIINREDSIIHVTGGCETDTVYKYIKIPCPPVIDASLHESDKISIIEILKGLALLVLAVFIIWVVLRR